MPESESRQDWFEDFLARQPEGRLPKSGRKLRRPRRTSSKKVDMCRECEYRPVSTGSTQVCIAAREEGLCKRCYQDSD